MPLLRHKPIPSGKISAVHTAPTGSTRNTPLFEVSSSDPMPPGIAIPNKFPIQTPPTWKNHLADSPPLPIRILDLNRDDLLSRDIEDKLFGYSPVWLSSLRRIDSVTPHPLNFSLIEDIHSVPQISAKWAKKDGGLL